MITYILLFAFLFNLTAAPFVLASQAKPSEPPSIIQSKQTKNKFIFHGLPYKSNCKAEYLKNPQLAAWLISQRSAKRMGRLHPERERLLNEVGFTWGKRPSSK